jgi:hypothetical protein
MHDLYDKFLTDSMVVRMFAAAFACYLQYTWKFGSVSFVYGKIL